MNYLIYFALSVLGPLAALTLFCGLLYLLEESANEEDNYNGR